MKVAIIGSGISGLTSAFLLKDLHEITIFDKNDYAGGHTHTIDVHREEGDYAVDTGFIVFNRKTYPNFCKILDQLEVQFQPTRMDFSVKSEKESFEYNARTLHTLFSSKKNLLSPSFYRMFLDALKFGKEFDKILEDKEEEKIDEYLTRHGYSRRFIEHLIIPMGAALWSSDPEQFRSFPVKSFVRFFKNHGFMGGDKDVQWLVIKGGSREYVKKMLPLLGDRLHLNTEIKKVSRFDDRVELTAEKGGVQVFDEVIFACHSDEALKILEEPDPEEVRILEALPYKENRVYLHTDESILPQNPEAWAAWNYLIPPEKLDKVAITYDMNILQTIKAPVEFCVTLNKRERLDESKIIGSYTYSHPQYDPGSLEAQILHDSLSGKNRTHYCGAYWGYGFHEDGVRSAVNACRKLGGRLE